MKNNEVFKKMLILTDLIRQPETVKKIMILGSLNRFSPSDSQIRSWRAHENDRRHRPMPDEILNYFFDGLFLMRDELRQNGQELFDLTKHYSGNENE